MIDEIKQILEDNGIKQNDNYNTIRDTDVAYSIRYTGVSILDDTKFLGFSTYTLLISRRYDLNDAPLETAVNSVLSKINNLTGGGVFSVESSRISGDTAEEFTQVTIELVNMRDNVLSEA